MPREKKYQPQYKLYKEHQGEIPEGPEQQRSNNKIHKWRGPEPAN